MIVNQATGEQIRILTTGSETGGELLVFELRLAAGGRVPAPHLHPVQQEVFQVLEGRLRVRTGRRVRMLRPGEAAVVPAGTAHGFSNPGPGPALVRVEVRPALRTAELLEVGAGLGARPGPLPLARFLSRFADEVAAPVLPGFVAKAAKLLARCFGEPAAP